MPMAEPNETPDPFGRPRPQEVVGEPPGFYRYRGTIPLMDLPYDEGPSMADFEWALQNRDLHRKYQGLFVAVYDRKVWGVGKDSDAAWDDAFRKLDCPPRHKLAFLAVVGIPDPA